MTQQRSNDDIRADVRYLNEHEAQTGRRSSAHVLLTHDVEPLLARVSELEKERDAYKRAKEENDDRFMLERDEARDRAERAEAQVRAVEALCANDDFHSRNGYLSRVAKLAVRSALTAALSGLSLQEEQE